MDVNELTDLDTWEEMLSLIPKSAYYYIDKLDLRRTAISHPRDAVL